MFHKTLGSRFLCAEIDEWERLQEEKEKEEEARRADASPVSPPRAPSDVPPESGGPSAAR